MKKTLSAIFTLLPVSMIFMLFAGQILQSTQAEKKLSTGRSAKTFELKSGESGNSWINLRGGESFSGDFTGSEADVNGLTQPAAAGVHALSLATADFDEDGMPDLIAAYGAGERGIIAFYRGSADAVYPNSPEAKARKENGSFTGAPFLRDARLISAPERADFLAAGDFDADAHWDVIAARRGASRLYFFKGKGTGEFKSAETIDLNGQITALTTGDANRRDGLEDIAVAVTAGSDAKILIFEGALGAIRAEPEAFDLPAGAAKTLVFGQFDASFETDLAAAAGAEILIVHGRDRKISSDKTRREIEPPQVSRRAFPFVIENFAVGDFLREKNHRLEFALLSKEGTVHLLQDWDEKGFLEIPGAINFKTSNPSPPLMISARVSSRPVDTLIIGAGDNELHFFTSDALPSDETETEFDAQKFSFTASLEAAETPAAILPMRLNPDAFGDLIVLGENTPNPAFVLTEPAANFTVNSTGNEQDCQSNDGVCAVGPFVNGQCTGPCTLLAAISQANQTSGASEINFALAGPFQPPPGSGTGFSNPVTIDGTTSPTGYAEIVNKGLVFRGSSVARGLVMNRTNPALSITHIILNFSDSGIIEGNIIGLDATGTIRRGGNTGVQVGFGNVSNNNLIGGTAPAARNVISGMEPGINTHGILIGNNDASTGNIIQGNYIGTDITGSVDLGNNGHGVLTHNGSNFTFGGTSAGAGNVISGNDGNGLMLIQGTGFLVQGNRIGTSAGGNAPLGNGVEGIRFQGCTSCTAGGTSPAARNTISANGGDGINVVGVSSAAPGLNAVIQGNYIGVNSNGASGFGNGGSGILLAPTYNHLIGGDLPAAGNVISANALSGVRLNLRSVVQTGDQILNNKIGTDATGNFALGNEMHGIELINSPVNTLIAGNIVAGNGGHGILLGNGTANARVLSNFIGTNDNPARPQIGNGGDGINSAPSILNGNSIGAINQGNTIVFNQGNGVRFSPGTTASPIRGNSIFSNGWLGIDLTSNQGGKGVSPNDVCDADQGANRLQNYPVLSSAVLSGGNLTVSGTLDSAANSSYTVDFYASSACSASGSGEGEFYLGSTDVSTGASCLVNINATLPFQVAGASFITATATDADGNTSEFSACRNIGAGCSFSIDPASRVFQPAGGGGTINVTAGKGCAWTAVSNDPWISITGGASGAGDAVVSFNVQANTGTTRTGTISVAGQTFTVIQESGCAVSIAPSSGNFPRQGGQGSFNVAAGTGCGWNFTSSANWIDMSASGGTGSGTVSFFIAANNGGARAGTISMGGLVFTVRQAGKTLFDFDGDSVADISVFRPGDTVWYLLQSQAGFSAAQFGISTDKPVPADYDGDGRTDIAVYRQGVWYWLNSSDNTFQAALFGLAGDIPVPGDYMGSARAELAVYRDGTWYQFDLAANEFRTILFGLAGDKTVPADYDGDGKWDAAVYRGGTWYLLQSTAGFASAQFGLPADRPIAADYDGDGRADLSVYRDGTWYLLQSQLGFAAFQWGISSDIPAPADYDGDGRTDAAVYRDGVWYVLRSSDGSFAIVQFGLGGDVPLPAANLP